LSANALHNACTPRNAKLLISRLFLPPHLRVVVG